MAPPLKNALGRPAVSDRAETGGTKASASEADSRPGYGRWRAATLTLVYVLFAVHVAHWKLRGQTLAPLELNEVMYTLEVGVITAGFLFMCATAVGTLLFGRFFCSWGCHILALQDLSRWALGKLGISRPRPVRSRILLLVPILAAFYMLFWPQLKRVVEGRPLPELHLRTDAEGWASFITNDFWRNLPGPWIAGLTFLLCGFVIVYLLGSRSFCAYACPYGAIFAFLDRLAPGRIRVTEDCVQCATCTATCSSGIRVHEEVDRHRTIVNPACLKDLDCVAACPENALYYGWGKPALWKSLKSGGRFGGFYDFTIVEDLLMAAVFLVILVVFRGLYGAVPFLMTLGLGVMFAFLSVYAKRLCTSTDARLRSHFLKRHGRLTRSGWAYAWLYLVLFGLVGHSAYIRYNEVRGLAWQSGASGPPAALASAEAGYAHLLAADRHGLFRNERVERALLAAASHLDRHADSERWALRILDRYPGEAWIRLRLAESLVAQGRVADAEPHFVAVAGRPGALPAEQAAAHGGLAGVLVERRDWQAAAAALRTAAELAPSNGEIQAQLGAVLAELGLFDQALAALEEAVSLMPELGEAHYNLGTLRMRSGRFDLAVESFEQAIASQPDDSMTLNNLGFSLERVGRVDQAISHLEHAIVVDPGNADAHFNLARLLFARGHVERAEQLVRAAARLDERYRRFLE